MPDHHPVVVRHGRSHRHASGVVSAFNFCTERFLLFPIGAAIALVWANTGAESYFRFAEAFRFLVNDVGMAFVFALMAQEIVEAVMPGGALHSWRRWGMAIVGAAGGIAGAALVYLAYVGLKYEAVLEGAWPIACAMDVAVAYYVLKSICRRSALLPFVLLLGIVTNLFSMIVVAVNHPVVETRTAGVVLVAIALGFAFLLRASKVPTFWPYLALSGTVSWWAFYWIGVHPALAFLPIVALLPHEPRKLDLFASPPEDDTTHRFEHEWHSLVQVILFFFGLVNAGVLVSGWDTGSWALLTAALVGRPAGMMAAIGLATVLGMHLPARVRRRDLLVTALATSSGFAFALFYATEMIPLGAVRQQITIAALMTIAGAAITFFAARLLKVGRYAERPPADGSPHGRHHHHHHHHDRHHHRRTSRGEQEAPWGST